MRTAICLTAGLVMLAGLLTAAISFYVTSEYQGNPIKLVYKGQVQDDGIHFNMGLEDGSWGVDFVAKRGA